MRRVFAVRRALMSLVVLALGGGRVPSAAAFEFLDGKLQVHGFFEEQIRTLSRDFSLNDGLDLAQWYHVLNVEIDYDVAPDGWGPFNLISTFARIEVRYDCVWTRGCGLLRNVDVYGDRAAHLPKRLSNARERGFVGTVPVGDSRPLLRQRRDQLEFGFKNAPVGDRRVPGPLSNVDGINELFAQQGPDGLIGNFDDPAPYVFQRFDGFRFANRNIKDATDLRGIQTLGPWLPKNKIRPIAVVRERANPFRGAVDPFRNVRADGADAHPVITYPDLLPGQDFLLPSGLQVDGQPIIPANGITNPGGIVPPGSQITDVEKPFRMAPNCRFDDLGCPSQDPQGLFYPSPALRGAILEGKFDAFDQNFSQSELALNRGASQEDEKEIKELYVDMELLDSALWLRLGKQNIVWGKTELFRTTDQFNPQDFALATLPELEESRVALWGIRGVYSFYEVGPLEDTRLELAMNFDQFEPVDIGRCGEPFAVNLVCLKTFGLFAHGITGIGLAGEERPPLPWNDTRGLELGGRLEFRWGRFSFQISDFYGYGDFPILERLFTYERNVDPFTGMPRRAGARGPCSSADLDGNGLPDRTDPACLQGGQDALFNHSANQTLFAVACASTIGFTGLEPSSCGVNVLNSRQAGRVDTESASDPLNGIPPRGLADNDPTTLPSFFFGGPIVNSLSTALDGNVTGRRAIGQFLGLTDTNIGVFGYLNLNGQGGVNLNDIPLVKLVVDLNDNRPEIPDLPFPPSPFGPGVTPPVTSIDPGIDGTLSAEQEALLGCGPFFEVQQQLDVGLFGCHENGIDLLNTEASVLVQSWPGFEGFTGTGFDDFVFAAQNGVPVPGTVGFRGGPVATRTVGNTVVQIPGARGPGDPGYLCDPVTGQCPDGTPPNTDPPLTVDIARHPFACTSFSAGGRPQGCQPFRSELAALSWNFLISLVMLSGSNEDRALPENQNRLDFFDPQDPFSQTRCSFNQMLLCNGVQAVFGVLGVRRATVRAGGRNGFGRRDFAWHQGGEAFLRYEKRNVLGFALDFAEDITKSNWGVETTWIEGIPFIDNDEVDGLTRVNTFNMTVSVDRPTFVNFMNANRTFFFNSQWFFQYVAGFQKGFTTNGPLNILGTFTIITGYFQDRLLPQVTFVYDVESASGGLLSQLTYRFSEKFSATFGVNAFIGRFEAKRAPINDLVPTRNRVGRGANKEFVENLLSLVRERDEFFLKIRYTF